MLSPKMITKITNYVNAGDFDGAILLGKEVERKTGLNYPLFIKLLALSLDQKSLQVRSAKRAYLLRRKAFKLFRKLLNYKKFIGDAYKGMGLIHLHDKRPRKALALFEKAKRLAPEDISIQLSIGNAHRALQNYDEAISHYRKALRRKHTRLPAIINIALTYKDLGDNKSASTWAYKGIKQIKNIKSPPWTKPFLKNLRTFSVKK